MKNMIQDQNAVTALIGGTLIDGTGKPPVKDSTIILQGNIIKKVGTKSEVHIPENAEVFDLSNKTVVPGFIDSHFHYYVMSIIPKILQ